MEKEVNIQDELTMRLTPMAEQYLLAATKWAKFLAIIGFVMSGLMIIMALSIGSLLSLATAMGGAAGAGMAGVPVVLFSIVYIAMGLVYFFIAFYMYNFASKTQRGILRREDYNIEAGFKALKIQLTIMGVMVIIGLSFFALIFVIAIIAAIAGLML
jgi:hypothetical protein